MAETRINTECFLPTWEGVSKKSTSLTVNGLFPPYMGGCIVFIQKSMVALSVSSLHGRVYRLAHDRYNLFHCFLPTWEGVSEENKSGSKNKKFPPYMGGCIVLLPKRCKRQSVSSLHGRVYRQSRIPLTCDPVFPPYLGGCIGGDIAVNPRSGVSSLHGRVYRKNQLSGQIQGSFLPTWEGVSGDRVSVSGRLKFPPCMGGCII